MDEILLTVRDSVIRMEGKLDLMNSRTDGLEKRICKLEDSNTWLYRLIIGQVVVGVLGLVILNVR